MKDIVERLREGILADAFESHVITSGDLTDRLIRERHDAADEIERLRAALKVIIRIYADTRTDYARGVQQTARAALDGAEFVDTFPPYSAP